MKNNKINEEIRNKLFDNSKKIILWKNILPKSYEVKTQLYSYKSDININEFRNKLYMDETYGYNLISSEINYARLYGNWEISSYNEDDKFILKIIDGKSGQFMELVFPTISDGICFINELYADKDVVQIGKGINVENIINKEKKIQYELSNFVKIIPTLLLSLVTIFAAHKIKEKVNK